MRVPFFWTCPHCDAGQWYTTEIDDASQSKPVIVTCNRADAYKCPIYCAAVELDVKVVLYTLTPVPPEFAANLAEGKVSYGSDDR